MRFRFLRLLCVFLAAFAGLTILQVAAQSSSSSTNPHTLPKAHSAARIDSGLDAGSVNNGLYHNSALGFSCKIPEGWVLRTEEMNKRDEDQPSAEANKKSGTESGRVLLAAFSRPPEARGEDVNSSILIAAEPVSAYPGLKDAAQYFGPLAEVAKAQGLAQAEDPYEFAVGANILPRADFQKDVGTRVMHQSTLAVLARGYAVSFTFIGGTEDEIEELIDGLSFAGGENPKPNPKR